jgi:hypothetical protein
MGQTALLPLWRKACWGFFCPKNPTALAGFEPTNLGTKGQHATSRPPKPQSSPHCFFKFHLNNTLWGKDGTQPADCHTLGVITRGTLESRQQLQKYNLLVTCCM